MDISLPLFLFWLKKLVSALVLPPLLPFVLIGLGLLFIWRRWRGGFALSLLGLLIGLASISPVIVRSLFQPLEPSMPLQMADASQAQAIVILGGGRLADAPEYGGDTVNHHTLERLRYGAHLERATHLPVLVSGGAPEGNVSEAQLMKAVLEDDFKVAVRWTEENSRDTHQNARYSAARLKSFGIRHILLVTHAAHMKRAQAEFEAQGMIVTAAPTAWQGRYPNAWLALPSAGAASSGWYALHEWLGLLAFRLNGNQGTDDSQ
ncbi:MAG: YdcF family protein [Azoarcus sp.]|jgi:uncharacterized SAM-binding protein YcdF (DUF218 family)|nr:YdcF family protein [Azoarcus sp.]